MMQFSVLACQTRGQKRSYGWHFNWVRGTVTIRRVLAIENVSKRHLNLMLWLGIKMKLFCTHKGTETTAGYKSEVWDTGISYLRKDFQHRHLESFKDDPKSIMLCPPSRLPLSYSFWESQLPWHGDAQAARWEARVIRKDSWDSCRRPYKWTTWELSNPSQTRQLQLCLTAGLPPQQRPKLEPRPPSQAISRFLFPETVWSNKCCLY